MAVNLAGPGEQETTNFFTRQGGVFLTNRVYGKLLINFCAHFVDSQSSTHIDLSSAPSIAPGNVEVNRLNDTAMNVSWVPMNLIESRGFVQSYIIAYQQASTGSRRKRQMQMETVDGSASSAIVGGLQPGVAYEVTVSGMTTENGPGELE